MKSTARAAAAGSALLATALLNANTVSETATYSLADRPGINLGMFAYFAVDETGRYDLTVTARDDGFFIYDSSVNPTQLGCSTHLSFWGLIDMDFAYYAAMPSTIDTSCSEFEIFGIYFAHLCSDENATYSGWVQYGNGPHESTGGTIGTVAMDVMYWW